MHDVDEPPWWIAVWLLSPFFFLVSYDSIYIVIACSGVFAIQCPECGTGIEKKSGCNHMRCRCGCEFCYFCHEMNCGADHQFLEIALSV